MEILNTAAILITLAAFFSYLNHRFLKIPTTIGIMLISLLMSLGLLVLQALGLGQLEQQAERMVRGIDFYETLMDGMLSFLLFAGALHVNLEDLSKQRWVIVLLAGRYDWRHACRAPTPRSVTWVVSLQMAEPGGNSIPDVPV